jgi:alpha-D-ribose 1-methylphosphonate 5-triphosphate synthase subunit PhnL
VSRSGLNLARAFIHPYPVLLLDEATASLDAGSRNVMVGLVRDRLAEAARMLPILPGQAVRDSIGTRIIDLDRMDRAA